MPLALSIVIDLVLRRWAFTDHEPRDSRAQTLWSDRTMMDVIFVAAGLVFFLAMLGYTQFCEHL